MTQRPAVMCKELSLITFTMHCRYGRACYKKMRPPLSESSGLNHHTRVRPQTPHTLYKKRVNRNPYSNIDDKAHI